MTLTNAYVTSNQFKDHAGIDDSYSSDAEDRAINAASRAIDRFCHRRFYLDSSTSARYYQATDPNRLYVDDFSTTTGLTVKTDEADSGTYSQTWTITTDFILNSPVVDGQTGWPYYRIDGTRTRRFPTSGLRQRVEVTAKWGWAAVPDEVVEACLIKAHRLLKRKESPTGVLGGFDFGAVRVSKIEDPDVCALLEPFVRANAVLL